MQDFNQVNLIGRLTKDAELKEVNGYQRLDFAIAFSTSKKEGDQYIDESNYLNLTMWGKVASAIHPYMKKGTQVLITGDLHQDRWEKDGQKLSALKVNVRNVQLLGSRNSNAAKTEEPSPSSNLFSEDIPF